MDINDLKTHIFYYSREKLYNSMLKSCKEGKNKFSSDVTIHFYHGLSLSLNNRYQEGIRELESLRLESEIQLAVVVALMYSHKLMGTRDKDIYKKLDDQMREFRKKAESIDLYNTSYALFTFRKYEKAYDYIEKALALEENADILGLKGWIMLYLIQNNLREFTQTSTVFEMALQHNLRCLDSAIGLVNAYLLENNTEEAVNAINKVVVRFPSMILPLIQKMKVQFTLQDYEQALETINRIYLMENLNLEALRIQILILLCRDSNYDEASACISKFIVEMEKHEPRNSLFFLECGKLFSRICSRNKSILLQTYKMVEKAVQVLPNNYDYINELAYQNLLQGRTKEALKYYKSATKINETSIHALIGVTLCELTENGISDTIRQQIEFLLELQEKEVPAMLYYMEAKLNENPDKLIDLLKKTCDVHLKLIKNRFYNEEYLKILDPDFLLDVVKETLRYVPQSSDVINRKSVQKNYPLLDVASNILKIITKACPGLKEALFLLAKVQYLKHDHVGATETLNHILNSIDGSSSDAYMLMAQIQIGTEMFDRAAQNLEVALSHNFKVRESPLYHLLTGLVEKYRKNTEESIKCFTTALSLIDIKPQDTSYKRNKDETYELTLADKASIYLELIEGHKNLNQLHEATKLLQDAIEEFQDTPEEARIMILNADYAISRKNVQNAIDMLNKVEPHESYYLEARTKLAQIYLKERMDKRAYLQCYQEMVNMNPGPDSYILLGDAYMHILEPDTALESYEKALQMNPKDPFLMSKMGSALVETHYFARAINYYIETINATDDPELKLQLADLYIQLKKFDKAEEMLLNEIEKEKGKNVNDLVSLKYRTGLFMLLAQIFEKSGNYSRAMSVLKDGKDNQNRVRKLYAMENAVASQDEIDVSVEINIKLAEMAANLREYELAINNYKDALVVSPNNFKTLTALAKLYMQINYLELCQQTCTNLLNLDPENESASIMMADIAFRKVDFDMALFHFTQLLNKQPTNWAALVRLVEIFRRTGNVDGAAPFLEKAEQNCTKKELGLLYATGLYEWYSGNLNAALRNFNFARQSPIWRQQAISNMIEICLNPDDEMLNDQIIDPDDSEYRDSRSMAIKTAEKLLKEFKQKVDMTNEEQFKYRLLINFLLIATKEKLNIERALEDFISIASTDVHKESVGPILGIATAYTMLKQNQRAKNQLKRVVKTPWTFEDAEYLERCWLLLADFYIQSSKYDLASDLLKRVLQFNKSCSKAYELSGIITEKEQHYKDAASFYEFAWKFNGKNNPSVGYKLAYNLMKSKKFADAIDVCQVIMKSHPDYPKIKKEILDKCIHNLRT